MLRGAPEPYIDYITELLNRFIILEFTNDTLNETVKIYKKLKEKGTLINELDIMIAGIAATNNETLITKNTDFRKLESDKIIVLQKQ